MKRQLNENSKQGPSKGSKIPRLAAPQDSFNPVIIVHNEDIQREFRNKNTPWGLKYEIARRTCGETELPTDYLSFLATLKKNATNVETVPQIEKWEQKNWSEEEISTNSPWAELDKEEEALSKDEYAGIGNNPKYPGWWAGKVDFRATLKLVDGNFRIVLERCVLGPSCKLKRRFGSKCILRVKVQDKIRYDDKSGVIEYFKRPFIIWDAVFRAFYAKGDTVFLYKTDEVMKNGRLIETISSLSLNQFIEWMNPTATNTEQKMCKWASRMALGLSSSVPGPRFAPENIKDIGDVFSDEGSDMTDGCGLSTIDLPKAVFHMHHLDTIPTAIQMRIRGAKGLFLMDRELEASGQPEVQVRGSQVKINYSPTAPLDPSHCTIDLLRFSRVRIPARTSEETIKNLHHNGVPEDVFKELLETRLRETVGKLLAWDGKNAMLKLWLELERAENVLPARRARESPTDSRWKGFVEQELDEDLDEDEDDLGNKTQIQHSLPWWMDPTSGCPSSMAESAMSALDSGFTPQECPYVRDKIFNITKMKVKTITSNFRYDIPQSASALVVPDPYGVLGPDEIHFKSSRQEFPTEDGLMTDIIVGDVLITRNPCKVSTDVRKVRAVEHPRLSSMVDVIVCSIQGYRRFLDFLAGGDYDGDRGTVIWNQRFVVPFKNADEKFSKPPDDIDLDFEIDGQTVGEFHNKYRTSQPDVRTAALQDYLLGALRNPSVVGEYSKFHENASYMKGYDAEETYRFAYKFCINLDAAKTGHKLRRQVHEKDKTAGFHGRKPLYKTALEKKAKFSSTTNEMPLERPRGLPKFIMDILLEAAIKQRDDWLSRVEKHFSSIRSNALDEHLAAPWKDAVAQAKKKGARDYQDDMGLISKHVEEMYAKRKKYFGKDFTSQDIRIRQDTLRKLSKEFAAFPTPDSLRTVMDTSTIERLKASYAYIYATQRSQASFPFDMAFRELCAIKAKACGLHKVCGQGFYEKFKLTGIR